MQLLGRVLTKLLRNAAWKIKDQNKCRKRGDAVVSESWPSRRTAWGIRQVPSDGNLWNGKATRQV